MSDWRDQFEVVDGSDKARKKCRLCGVVLDSRAGRAQKHLKQSHGELVVGPSEERGPPTSNIPRRPGIEGVGAAGSDDPRGIGRPGQIPDRTRSSNQFPRGSREWGIEYLRDIIDSPATSPDARLKALAELREWESFEGTAAFDDEIEAEKHMEQWDRVVKRARELRVLSKKLLRDATTRQDLLREITEIGG